jgi:hypothetical protein
MLPWLHLNWPNQGLLSVDPLRVTFGIQLMREWCRKSDCLPSACTLADTIAPNELESISQTAMSDVFRGTYAGQAVAVKHLRFRERNEVRAATRNVALLALTLDAA